MGAQKSHLSRPLAEYEGRFRTVADGRLAGDGLYVCYHAWSPYGLLVLLRLMQEAADAHQPIFLLDLSAVSCEEQQARFGAFSHGWGEMFYVTDGVCGRMMNSFRQYLVKRGDTLRKIATQHGVSMADLKRLNHLDRPFNRIRVGQRLIFYASSGSATGRESAPPT